MRPIRENYRALPSTQRYRHIIILSPSTPEHHQYQFQFEPNSDFPDSFFTPHPFKHQYPTAKMMEYFNFKKAKKHPDDAEKSEAPVLNDEDEAFLHRLASEGTPPPLPERPQDLPVAGESSNNDAQIAIMNGAQNIPLPDVPDTPDGVVPAVEAESSRTGENKTVKHGKKPFKWSFLRRDSRDNKRRDREVVATDLSSVAEGLKSADAKPNEDGNVSDHEAKKEEEEMSAVLERLNLAAINNRVFSISDESRELLRKSVFFPPKNLPVINIMKLDSLSFSKTSSTVYLPLMTIWSPSSPIPRTSLSGPTPTYRHFFRNSLSNSHPK